MKRLDDRAPVGQQEAAFEWLNDTSFVGCLQPGNATRYTLFCVDAPPLTVKDETWDLTFTFGGGLYIFYPYTGKMYLFNAPMQDEYIQEKLGVRDGDIKWVGQMIRDAVEFWGTRREAS